MLQHCARLLMIQSWPCMPDLSHATGLAACPEGWQVTCAPSAALPGLIRLGRYVKSLSAKPSTMLAPGWPVFSRLSKILRSVSVHES